jgi:predicted esterase
MTAMSFYFTPTGTIYNNVQIPNLTGGGGGNWPHLIDFYVPSFRLPGQSATQALIALHGGGDTKAHFAQELHINNSMLPVISQCNWWWAVQWSCIVVVPQGQACNGAVNAWNPNGVTSTVNTWSNWDTWSGQNDVAFLNDLATYITSTYGISSTYQYLCGHSEGGIMTKRMWYESPSTFSHYCTMAGPASNYYLTNTMTPSVLKPLYCQVGGLDQTLNTYGGPNGAGTHFLDTLWTGSNDTNCMLSFPSFPTRLGEWVQFNTVTLPAAGQSAFPTPTFANNGGGYTGTGGVTTSQYSGIVTKWSDPSGKFVLQLTGDGDHPIITQEQCLLVTGQNNWLITSILNFCTSV